MVGRILEESAVADFTFGLSIGPQRCGTEHLRRYFLARKDVCLPSEAQEVFYFDRHFQRGVDFYLSHFHPHDTNHMLLELTTTAFDHAEAPKRVYNLWGRDAKLICPLRHPIKRSMKVYEDYISYGLVHGTVEEVVELAPQILFSSRYATHLERWFEMFGRENIKLIFFEDWEKDPEVFFHGACEGLGIEYQKLNVASSSYKVEGPFTSLLTQTLKLFSGTSDVNESQSQNLDSFNRHWLEDRLGNEVPLLEDLLGHKISAWRD